MTKPSQDATFIIGPPGPAALKEQVSQWASKAGRSDEDAWQNYVHAVIRSMLEKETTTDCSRFDELLSKILKEPVTAKAPFLGTARFRGSQCPTVMILAGSLSGPGGSQPSADLLGAERNTLASLFGMLLKSEWVQCV